MQAAIKQAELLGLEFDVENGSVFVFDGFKWVCTFLADPQHHCL